MYMAWRDYNHATERYLIRLTWRICNHVTEMDMIRLTLIDQCILLEKKLFLMSVDNCNQDKEVWRIG